MRQISHVKNIVHYAVKYEFYFSRILHINFHTHIIKKYYYMCIEIYSSHGRGNLGHNRDLKLQDANGTMTAKKDV